MLLTETDRDRRWRTTAHLHLDRPAESRRVIFDLSQRDAYKDPGQALRDRRPDGQTVLLQDGPHIYLSGMGATPEGNRPFLDKLDLETLAKERLYQSDASSNENVVAFAGGSRTTLITRYESKTQPPNYYLVDLATQEAHGAHRLPRSGPRAHRRQARDPEVPAGRRRAAVGDVVPAARDTRPGTRLPVLVWAYPHGVSPTPARPARCGPRRARSCSTGGPRRCSS